MDLYKNNEKSQSKGPEPEVVKPQYKPYFYKDMVLVRFNDADNNPTSSDKTRLEIMTPQTFSETCTKRSPNDKYFLDIIYMMVNTKNKLGYGQPITVHFFAPMQKDRVDYDFEGLGDDVVLIRTDE